MKKLTAIILLLCMTLALCACGAPKAQDYSLGLGVSANTDSSKDGNAQVDATVAAVVTDKDGKIVACRLDCAQNKMDVSAGTVDTAAAFKSKVELGDDYNMVAYSDATYEWYQQAEAFEAYVVGKTGAEVAAMETVVNEEGHSVTVDETLYATCSISIADFIEAVSKACSDTMGQTFSTADAFTLGVACISTADESTDATDADNGVAKLYTEFGAAVVGADGKVIAALNDAIQPQIAFDKAGAIQETTYKGTKKELGPDYGMVAYGASIAEWDAQSKAFSDYCAGKTAAEIRGIETVVNEEGHNVSVDETLLASCTISISGMMAVIAQAADYAR